MLANNIGDTMTEMFCANMLHRFAQMNYPLFGTLTAVIDILEKFKNQTYKKYKTVYKGARKSTTLQLPESKRVRNNEKITELITYRY